MKKILLFLSCAVFIFSSCGFLCFASEISGEHQKELLVDNANLLSYDEFNSVLSALEEVSERQKMDVAIVTVYSLDGKSPMDYADDYYDYNGYGQGDSSDGLLLLLSMEYRDYYITTCGAAIDYFTDYGLNALMNDSGVLTLLGEGSFAEAFIEFSRQCDAYITQGETDEPYDVGNPADFSAGTSGDEDETPILFFVIVSVLIGFLVSFLIMKSTASKLKEVRFKRDALGYLVDGSLKISESYDRFLYSSISKVQRVSETNNSYGGSSTHMSSSGTSHGGGGGKF